MDKKELDANISLAKLCSGEIVVGKYNGKSEILLDCLVLWLDESNQSNMSVGFVPFFGIFDQSLRTIHRKYIMDFIDAPKEIMDHYIKELQILSNKKKEVKKESERLYH